MILTIIIAMPLVKRESISIVGLKSLQHMLFLSMNARTCRVFSKLTCCILFLSLFLTKFI